MGDDLADLSVVFGANIDQVTSAGAMVEDIFTAIAENAAVSGADISESMTAAAESLASISEAATGISAGIEENVAGATEAIDTLAPAGEEAGSSIADSITAASSGFAELSAAADDTASSIAESSANASSSISSIGESAQSAASTAQDAGDGFDLGGMITQAGMAAFSLQALGTMGVQLAGNLLGPAASAETVDSALTTLLGSSKAASDELNTLDAFAAKTPFKTMDIDQAAEQLIGFKTKASDVVPDIKAIGDALGAVGRDTPAELNSVVDIFGKMQVTGKVTQATITQLGIHGIDALGAIAEGAGKSQAQIQAMIKNGTLPATDAIKDMTKGIEENPMLSGGMARSAGTFTGLMSTLKSNWDQLLVSFGSPIINALESHMNDLGNDLASPGFKAFAGTVGQGIVDAFTDIGNGVHYVQEILATVNLSDFKAAWHDVSVEVQQAAKWFEHLGGVIHPVAVDFDPLADVIQRLAQGGLNVISGLLRDVSGAFTEVNKTVQGGTTPLTGIMNLFKQISPTVQQLAGTFQTQFAPAIQKIGGLLAGEFMHELHDVGAVAQQVGGWFMTSVVPAIQKAMPGFESLGKVILTTVIPAVIQIRGVAMDFIEHVVKDFGPLIEKIIPPLIVFAGVMAGDIANAITFLTPIVLQIVQTVGTFADELSDRLAPIAIKVFTWISDQVTTFAHYWGIIWPGVSQILGGVWKEIQGIVQIAWSLVSGIILIGLDLLSGNWSQAWTDLKNMLGGIWDGIKTFVSGGIDTIKGIVATVWDGISGLLSKPFNDAWNTIKGIISNIQGAINNVAGGIGNAVSNFHVPGFAGGTTNAPGGLSLVGENGPELVMLNRGASVIPLNSSSSSSILSSSGGNVTHVHLYFDGQEMASVLVDPLMNKVVKQIRIHGGGKMIGI